MKMKKNAVEWSVFGASAIVIVALVGVLIHGVLTSTNTPPELRVTAGRTIATQGGFTVPVAVSNDGDTTAEQAKIEVRLLAGSDEVEKAELTFAFVPGKSKRNGWVVFSRDPQCCSIEARPVSFEAP